MPVHSPNPASAPSWAAALQGLQSSQGEDWAKLRVDILMALFLGGGCFSCLVGLGGKEGSWRGNRVVDGGRGVHLHVRQNAGTIAGNRGNHINTAPENHNMHDENDENERSDETR